jgi:Threonine dehydrogenase and related Zn-dependent dehydrogenases
VAAEIVMKFPLWLETLPAGPLEFISTDFSPFREALAGTRFAAATIVDAPRALAGAIARIASTKRGVDAAEIDATTSAAPMPSCSGKRTKAR